MQETWFSSWFGKIPWRRDSLPTPVFLGFPGGSAGKESSASVGGSPVEEILAENFPDLGKEILNQVQKAQRLPGKINPRRNSPRHIVIKLTKIKDKDKILKVTREKWQTTYKGTSHQVISKKLYTKLYQEKLQTRREWHDIFKVMKGRNLWPRIL